MIFGHPPQHVVSHAKSAFCGFVHDTTDQEIEDEDEEEEGEDSDQQQHSDREQMAHSDASKESRKPDFQNPLFHMPLHSDALKEVKQTKATAR